MLPMAGIWPPDSAKYQADQLGLAISPSRDYGASGSGKTTTGTTTAGSTTLTLADALDFANGQGIAIVHAGAGPYQSGTTTALEPPTGLAVANKGTVGATTYKYWIAAVDEYGGITAAVSVTTTTGNATLSHVNQNYNYLTWTDSTGAAAYVIWGDVSNPASSQGILGLASHGVGHFLDMGLGAAGMGMGQGFTSSDLYPSTPTTASLGETLFTTVQSGAGSTQITMAHAATAAVTDQLVVHDDTSPLSTALAALVSAGGGTLDLSGATYYLRDGLTTTVSTAGVGLAFIGGGPGSGKLVSVPGYTGNLLDITGDADTQVLVANLELDGNKANQPFQSSEDQQCNVRLYKVKNSRVTGCVSHDCWYAPIRLGNGTGTVPSTPVVTDSVVDGNRVYEGYDQGIAVWNSRRVSVVGNTVERSGWSGISFTQSDECVATGNTCKDNFYFVNYPNIEGHGLAIEGGASDLLVGNVCEGSNGENIHVDKGPFSGTSTTIASIIGNTARDSVMAYGISVSNTDGIGISGNVITGNASDGINIGTTVGGADLEGNQATDNLAHGINVNGSTSPVSVCGNYCAGNTNNGITLGSFGTLTGFRCDGNLVTSNLADQINASGATAFSISRNIVLQGTNTNGSNGILVAGGSAIEHGGISGNTVVGGNNSAQGIIVLSASGLTIEDNVVSRAGGNAGIDLRGVSDSFVTGNQSFNNRGNPGILLEDNGGTHCLHNVVADNNLYDDQTTHTQMYGLEESGSTDYTVIRGNRFANNTSAAVSLVGAHSTVADNIGVNPAGWGVTTPSLPAGTGSASAVENATRYRVRVYQSGGAGTHVVDPAGTDTALPADPVELVLDPLAKVYFATTVPSSWDWYGV